MVLLWNLQASQWAHQYSSSSSAGCVRDPFWRQITVTRFSTLTWSAAQSLTKAESKLPQLLQQVVAHLRIRRRKHVDILHVCASRCVAWRESDWLVVAAGKWVGCVVMQRTHDVVRCGAARRGAVQTSRGERVSGEGACITVTWRASSTRRRRRRRRLYVRLLSWRRLLTASSVHRPLVSPCTSYSSSTPTTDWLRRVHENTIRAPVFDNTYFTVSSDLKKHHFLRFFLEVTYQKVVKSL